MTKDWPTLNMGLLSVIFLIAFGADARDLPTEHTPGSEYSIDYSDLDLILKGSVLDMGPSTHKPPNSKLVKINGSRLQIGNTRITHQEGNRVMIHAFEEPELIYLQKMRNDLLSIQADLPLAALSKREQLAYWLNLYTVIVLAELADQYPITRLKPLFDIDRPDAFVNQQLFRFGERMISLADIEHHILTNWTDPVVIYGFYMGAVGTPNIRTSAYNSAIIYDQLRENAVDFVNSMRGTQMWNRSELRVSKYYRRMAQFFPNFDDSILAHVQKYAKPSFRRRLITVRNISAEIEDWHIADLYNGNLSQPGGNYPRITKNAEGVSYKIGLPLHVVQFLRERERKISRQRGIVDIEELPQMKKPD